MFGALDIAFRRFGQLLFVTCRQRRTGIAPRPQRRNFSVLPALSIDAEISPAKELKERHDQADADQPARSKLAQPEHDQRGDAVGVENVAAPQQDEHVDQAEQDEQAVAPVIVTRHSPSPGRLGHPSGQDHHAGAEQQFEQAPRGAVGEDLAQPPRDLVGGRPAEMADIDPRAERRAHIVDVHEQYAEDRDPAQDIEHRDARRTVRLLCACDRRVAH